MVQMPQRRDRSFAGKVQPSMPGYERVRDFRMKSSATWTRTFPSTRTTSSFSSGNSRRTRLWAWPERFSERKATVRKRDSFEGHKHVSGQCQLFRRQCWEEIGGYIPHRAGGIDWMAVTTARMMGWKTESFREKCVLPLPPPGNGGTQRPRLVVLLRGERLLSRRASGLGIVPRRIPDRRSGLISSMAWPWAWVIAGRSSGGHLARFRGN